jgi:hypothetical protein
MATAPFIPGGTSGQVAWWQRTRSHLRRQLVAGLLVLAAASGGVAFGATHHTQATPAVRPPVATATALTMVPAAASRLDLEIHERDYCNCNK